VYAVHRTCLSLLSLFPSHSGEPNLSVPSYKKSSEGQGKVEFRKLEMVELQEVITDAAMGTMQDTDATVRLYALLYLFIIQEE
jgi:hypothetical protein